MKTKNSPRILLLDIETAPATAYVWRLFDENVGLDQLISPGRVICFAAQWLGSAKITFRAEWTTGGKLAMLRRIHQLLEEADAVITYNGDHFDLPKLQGEFLAAGLHPPAPVTSIDLYKAVKKLGYQSGKLQFVAPFLGIGEKVKHEGFRLWRSVEAGDERARVRMERYNKQDTRLLSKLYKKLRPYITSHPYLFEKGQHKCSACGSKHLQHRGYRRTRAFKFARLQCQACGHWDTGVKVKVGPT
jgi:hypothetical protein